MGRCFTEDEVRQIVAAAVAEAVAPLKARIAKLEADNQRLKAEIAQLKKDSTTSSKPPSSDIIKAPHPPKSGGKRAKRRPGGQPGHARHTRPTFPPDEVDQLCQYELPTVPLGWKALDQFRVLQQVELVEKPYTVTEHRARLYENLRTGQVRAAPWPPEVRQARAKVRAEVLAVAERAPMRSEAQNMAKRFRDHGDAYFTYFTFLETPGSEPTNNSPERQIRFLAIDRKITQGTRGEAEPCWSKRIWTVLASCAQQGCAAFGFIHDSLIANFTDQPFPSLLPLPP